MIPASNEFVPVDEESGPARDRPLWFVVAVLIAVGVFTLGAWSAGHSPLPPPTGPYANQPAPAQNKILVHVAGAVRKPGVYEMPFDARINDAVKRAEPLPGADVDALNLAAWAEDGSRIEVPLKANAPAVPLPASTPAQTASIPSETTPTVGTPPTSPQKTAASPTKNFAPKNLPGHPININRASLDELTLLPGVGPALAERIVDYRKAHGALGTVDSLDGVKGFGPKKLEKLRAFATVR